MLMLVDVNEQATNPYVVTTLERWFPRLQVIDLEFGDINVILDSGDILAIERKNTRDFLGSIGDGRVFRQVERMAAGAKFYCIILVGEMSFDEDDMAVCEGEVTNWKGTSVRGAFYALQWSACPILMARNTDSLPFAVNEAIAFCSKPTEHQQLLNHHRTVTFPPVPLDIEILAAFPNIGIKRAEALMEFVSKTEFPCLGGALAWASVFPLIKEGGRPPGWGNKAVQNFRALLGLKDNQYLEIREESSNGSKESRKESGKQASHRR